MEFRNAHVRKVQRSDEWSTNGSTCGKSFDLVNKLDYYPAGTKQSKIYRNFMLHTLAAETISESSKLKSDVLEEATILMRYLAQNITDRGYWKVL